MSWRAALGGVLVGGALLAGAGLWAFQEAMEPSSRSTEAQWVTVRPGTSVPALARELHHKGLIRSPWAFQLWMRWVGADRRLQAGVYTFWPALGPKGIVALLAEGKVSAERFTVPEGHNLRQIGAMLEARLAGNAQRWHRLTPADFASRHPWLRDLPAGATLEGVLFPDTYVVPPGPDGPAALAGLMLQRFEEVALPVLRGPRPQGLAWPAVLTMASLVEKEAVLPEERAVIAGVFYRRLTLGMAFGSDPTVEYALGLHQDARGLSLRQVAVDSPYNTYKHPGLPPGPIANPGLASLRAAMAPVKGPHLYFVAEGGGRHRFTRTYAEHLAAQREILRQAKP